MTQFTLHVPIREPRQEFRVDKAFKTRSAITQRTVQVAEAFGLGIDEEREFVVFKDFVVDVNPGDVVYITGDSGSGKSLLLRQLYLELQRYSEFGGVVAEWELHIDSNEILVEGVGQDTSEALNLLSMAGLNEAFLFLRRYRELSDGQKYRYRVAKLIASGLGTWLLDEFVATLDRVTARVVAYTVQKTARRLGKTLLVATTHQDLLEDLQPTVQVQKRFGFEVNVRYAQAPRGQQECSVLQDVVIEPGSRADYQTLEQFHYRGGLPQLTRKVFVARLHGEIVGAIVYSCPHANLRGRNIALPQFRGPTTREKLQRINREILRIARVVVLPKYRSIGLGVKLVRETLPRVGVPYVETLAVMARYNPFFEKAGMHRVDTPPTLRDRSYTRALTRLEELGFNLEMLASKSHNRAVLARLTKVQFREAQALILREFIAEKFHRPLLAEPVRQGKVEAMAEALQGYRLPAVYLIWKNPAFTASPPPAAP